MKADKSGDSKDVVEHLSNAEKQISKLLESS